MLFKVFLFFLFYALCAYVYYGHKYLKIIFLSIYIFRKIIFYFIYPIRTSIHMSKHIFKIFCFRIKYMNYICTPRITSTAIMKMKNYFFLLVIVKILYFYIFERKINKKRFKICLTCTVIRTILTKTTTPSFSN